MDRAVQIWHRMVEEEQARREKHEQARATRDLRNLQLRNLNDGLGVSELLSLYHSGVFLVTVMGC